MYIYSNTSLGTYTVNNRERSFLCLFTSEIDISSVQEWRGLIQFKLPLTVEYELTDKGLDTALYFSKYTLTVFQLIYKLESIVDQIVKE